MFSKRRVHLDGLSEARRRTFAPVLMKTAWQKARVGNNGIKHGGDRKIGFRLQSP